MIKKLLSTLLLSLSLANPTYSHETNTSDTLNGFYKYPKNSFLYAMFIEHNTAYLIPNSLTAEATTMVKTNNQYFFKYKDLFAGATDEIGKPPKPANDTTFPINIHGNTLEIMCTNKKGLPEPMKFIKK